MTTARAVLRLALLAGLALAATAPRAHDSWLVADGAGAKIVTGTRYPRVDLEPPPDSVARSACETSGDARACWIELREFDITLDDKIVDVYLREARPGDAVRDRWQALRAGNTQWHERYRKFARIEIAGGETTAGQREALRTPAGLDLEVLPVGDAALDTGAAARFVVLSQGRPVRGLPVQLVSDLSPLGLWARTDERGEVAWTLPFAAHWLVRTILIEPDGGDRWKSRFATFAFQAR